jgi:hypothetical protein
MAFAPVVIITAHAIADHGHSLENETLIINGILQFYYVRCGIFFGCLGLFLRLVRGEIAERTLHYLFLAPVRREALLVGKFLAGVVTTVLVFGTGVLASFLVMYGHFPEGRAFLTHGPALAHLRLDLLVVLLACLGYGAVFLAFSLLFKNPVVPAVLLAFWEGVNGVLPAWLKHLSVTFYLKPLFPVELPMKGILSLFTVVAEPTPRGWPSRTLRLHRPGGHVRVLADEADRGLVQLGLSRLSRRGCRTPGRAARSRWPW